MSDLAKLTAEELLERGRLNAPCQPGSVMAEIRRRLERLEQCEKDAAEWKTGADIVGERLIAAEKRLEKCEADSKILNWLEQYSSFGVHTYTEAGKAVVYIDGGAGTAMHTRGSSLRDAARAALEE